MLSEDYFVAGGLPAVLAELLDAGALPHPEAMTANGRTMADNIRALTHGTTPDRRTIRAFSDPLLPNAGFLHLKGTLFDSALMKTSVITPAFRRAFLEDPADPDAFEGPVAVFDGPEDYHARVETAPIDERTILVMRGAGPRRYPGAAEVVNMQPPRRLLAVGVTALPCIGDGRQSGTSASPSILHVTPEGVLSEGEASPRAPSSCYVTATGCASTSPVVASTCSSPRRSSPSVVARSSPADAAAPPRAPPGRTCIVARSPLCGTAPCLSAHSRFRTSPRMASRVITTKWPPGRAFGGFYVRRWMARLSLIEKGGRYTRSFPFKKLPLLL